VISWFQFKPFLSNANSVPPLPQARTVTIKLKRATFDVSQRQLVLPSYTNDVEALKLAGLRLLRWGGAS
jgi:hypothetical protein